MSGKVREMMLFDYETTSRRDFRNGEIQPQVKTLYVEKPRLTSTVKQQPLKNLHTLTDYKDYLRFDIYWKPKPILRTNPWAKQEILEAPKDTELQNIRKTRPRVVMVPSFSLDNIENEEARDQLIKDTYTTTLMAMTQDIPKPEDKCIAPLPDMAAQAHSIYLPTAKPEKVPQEWRIKSFSWEKDQLRGYSDPTEAFWRARPPGCKVCKESAERFRNKEMKHVMKSNIYCYKTQ